MLQHFPTENPTHYLICYRKNDQNPWKIRIPDSLLAHTVNWYHLSLNHLGSKRLRDTIGMHSTHPHLGEYCEEAVKACRICQQAKITHRHYVVKNFVCNPQIERVYICTR